MLDYVTIHGDPDGRTSRWDFDGATRANTDDGRLYVSITASGGGLAVGVFADAVRSILVAQGALAGADSGAVTLSQQNSSGLSGGVRLQAAAPTPAIELDVFYACDDDLHQRQGELAGFLASGQFAGESGFKAVTAAAKRELDSWLAVRGLAGARFDSLRPLADVAAFLALAALYRHLARRRDDAASDLASRHDAEARKRLGALRLQVAGAGTTPFPAHLTRQ